MSSAPIKHFEKSKNIPSDYLPEHHPPGGQECGNEREQATHFFILGIKTKIGRPKIEKSARES